jgi:nucleoside-diphosphate-sugar epimerase
MKVLMIGGTGTISTAITKALLLQGHEIYLLNRGFRNDIFAAAPNLKEIRVNIHDEKDVEEKIAGLTFDVAADFIAYIPKQLESVYRLLKDRTRQFIFISSASAYQKPPIDYRITEETPLANPFWEYSRSKIACEAYLMQKYHKNGFPVTIVRPSHTYGERSVPLGVHGSKGSWQVVKRMMEGKPVIIHGDGTSLWTMTHNSDFAKGFIGLMDNESAIGEAVQITSDETLTWNQIYKAAADALGVKLHPYYVSSSFLAGCGHYDFNGSLIGDKANSVVFDNTKLKRLVPDFAATKPFAAGVKETVEYILAHPKLQVEDPEFDEWCDKVIAAQEKAAAMTRL